MLEYSLGHTTHAENLKRVVDKDATVVPTYVDLPFNNTPGFWSKLPVVKSNWSIRASLGAYMALRPIARKLDACLFHTQVTSLFSAGLMRKLPSVISLDATPMQYDELGKYYGHVPSGNSQLEQLKRRLNIRAFKAARKIVTWSEWTKRSLVDHYSVAPEKVTVIPPGIDTEKWKLPEPDQDPSRPIHLLFVGGDFERKGGMLLLEAFANVVKSTNVHLHIVTKTEGVGDGMPGVSVYRNVGPNSDKLLELFTLADIFVFPTLADCLPLAVLEALAAGRPIITTDVGALPEAVTHGETGLVVPVHNPAALADAIRTLATNSELRIKMGHRARAVALQNFDARTNYQRLVDVVKSVV